MKKLFIPLLLVLFFASGCSSSNVSNDSLKQPNIKGYWLQVERNWDGDIKDLTSDKNSYLKITDDRLFFYYYYSDTETYGVSDKYYKLEKDKIYYDYYELKGNDWKKNIDEAFGGIFYISIDDNKLTLTKYSNDKNKDDGYKIDTYKKIDAKDWPIEE